MRHSISNRLEQSEPSGVTVLPTRRSTGAFTSTAAWVPTHQGAWPQYLPSLTHWPKVHGHSGCLHSPTGQRCMATVAAFTHPLAKGAWPQYLPSLAHWPKVHGHSICLHSPTGPRCMATVAAFTHPLAQGAWPQWLPSLTHWPKVHGHSDCLHSPTGQRNAYSRHIVSCHTRLQLYHAMPIT
jgi:hypothetical protein